VGANAFTKAVSRWDDINSLSPITLPSATAWVEREGAIHPSTVLLQSIATAVMEGTVRGCMVQVGTLLMTPEGDLDETIQILRPKNPCASQTCDRPKLDGARRTMLTRTSSPGWTKLCRVRTDLNMSQPQANAPLPATRVHWIPGKTKQCTHPRKKQKRALSWAALRWK
jgi:hypothetical protein